jgi:hypothetical protein
MNRPEMIGISDVIRERQHAVLSIGTGDADELIEWQFFDGHDDPMLRSFPSLSRLL